MNRSSNPSPGAWKRSALVRAARAVFAIAASGAGAQTQNPAATTTGEEVIRLSEFQVTTSADKGYRAGNSVSATRIEAAIKDLPFTVNAFTDQFIADIGARDLIDVVKYAPGVTSAGREFNAGNTRFNLRGFDQLMPQRNGFVGTGYIDTVNVQRIEIVKGPASILYGQVQPGGTVNVITKTPAAKKFVAVNQQFGSASFWRSSLDANLPLNPQLAIRVNGSWENGSEHIDPSQQRTWVMSPTILFKPTANSSLVVDYQWFRRRENPPVFMKPNIRVEGLATAYTSPDGKTFTPIDFGFGPFFPLPEDFNYVGRNDFRDADFESLYAEYTLKLGDRWTARANYNWNRRSVRNKLTGVADARIWASGVQQTATAFSARAGNVATNTNGIASVRGTNGTFSFDPTTGAVSNGLAVGSIFLPRRARLQEEFGQGNAYQAELAGRHEFAGVKWRPLLGVFYTANNSRGRQRNLTDFYQPWDLMSPATWVDTPSSFGRASPALLPNGDYDVALIPLSSASISLGRDTAYYTAQSLSLFKDRLMLVGGARYNKAEASGDNYLVAADPSTVAGRNEANNNLWSSVSRTIYQGGAGFKITSELMAYASYSESFSVDSRFLLFRGDQSSKATPSLAKGKEAGLKSDFLGGRVSAALALFQIDQFNRVLNFSERVGTQSLTTQLQDTEDRSKGWEVETTLSPLDHWQVYLSYSNIDTKLTKVPVGLEPLLGARPEASVKRLFNVWSRYSFRTDGLKGYWIGAGVNYTGDKAQRVDNRLLTMPAYTLWDATVGYEGKWGNRPISASLAWKNITDEEYFPANQQRGYPSSVVLSLSTKF